MNQPIENDLRLIEAGFPCHQVGAETQRDRDTGKAPPPNRLHVWWARRPLPTAWAVIFAQMVDGLSAHLGLFPTEKKQ